MASDHIACQMRVDNTFSSIRFFVRELTELATDEKSIAMVLAELNQLKHSTDRMNWLLKMLGQFEQQQAQS